MQKIKTMFLPLKKSAKHFIPDLKNRDDFEIEQVEAVCIKCGGADVGYRYRFHDEENSRYYQAPKPCIKCEDKSYFDSTKEQHLQYLKEVIMNRYWFIPTDLAEAGFKNYKRTNNVTIKAVNSSIDYVKHFKDSDPSDRFNLLMMGNPGTGKSHLSVAIARTLKDAGFAVGFITTGKLLALIKDTYKKGASRTENDILEDISKLECLVLDDIGAEVASKDEFSWAKARLFDIVNSRIGKPTVYTTNFDDLNIEDAVGERVRSRLYNKTKYIDMFTDDFRKTLQIS
ncbi:MAG: ATP-binding protein [Heyndrickxia sp.]